MELVKGQKVAYPSQGICMVEDIASKRIGDSSIDFYSLRVLNDNSIIMVPTENAESVGIRPVISSIQCKQLIARLSADFEAISADWKSRSRRRSRRSTGDGSSGTSKRAAAADAADIARA